MQNRPSYYAIIPSIVRYDNRLKPNEKLLYGEITALANKLGICFASNKYFSELYDVSKETISRWLSDLKKYGYIDIKVRYKNGTKEVEKRGIVINGTIDNANFKYSLINGQSNVPVWISEDITENLATQEEIDELNELISID